MVETRLQTNRVCAESVSTLPLNDLHAEKTVLTMKEVRVQTAEESPVLSVLCSFCRCHLGSRNRVCILADSEFRFLLFESKHVALAENAQDPFSFGGGLFSPVGDSGQCLAPDQQDQYAA